MPQMFLVGLILIFSIEILTPRPVKINFIFLPVLIKLLIRFLSLIKPEHQKDIFILFDLELTSEIQSVIKRKKKCQNFVNGSYLK